MQFLALDPTAVSAGRKTNAVSTSSTGVLPMVLQASSRVLRHWLAMFLGTETHLLCAQELTRLLHGRSTAVGSGHADPLLHQRVLAIENHSCGPGEPAHGLLPNQMVLTSPPNPIRCSRPLVVYLNSQDLVPLWETCSSRPPPSAKTTRCKEQDAILRALRRFIFLTGTNHLVQMGL